MKKIIATSIYIFITIVLMIMTISKDVMAVTYSEVSKPLICLVGTDYSYLLEYEGYTIINKLVDFTCVGTYNIIYQHNTTKETITKRVDVINDNEFENIYYRYDKKTLLSTNNKIIDSFKINNVLFLLEEKIIDDIHIYTIAIYELKDIRDILICDKYNYIDFIL